MGLNEPRRLFRGGALPVPSVCTPAAMCPTPGGGAGVSILVIMCLRFVVGPLWDVRLVHQADVCVSGPDGRIEVSDNIKAVPFPGRFGI